MRSTEDNKAAGANLLYSGPALAAPRNEMRPSVDDGGERATSKAMRSQCGGHRLAFTCPYQHDYHNHPKLDSVGRTTVDGASVSPQTGASGSPASSSGGNPSDGMVAVAAVQRWHGVIQIDRCYFTNSDDWPMLFYKL